MKDPVKQANQQVISTQISNSLDKIVTGGFVLVLAGIGVVEFSSSNFISNTKIKEQIQSFGYQNIEIKTITSFGAFSSCGRRGNIQIEFTATKDNQLQDLVACRGGVIPPVKGMSIISD